MNYEELHGRKLAIVAMGDDERGKTEAAVFTGTGRWENNHLYLIQDGNQLVFEFPDDTLERIKPVPESVKDILEEADYYVAMSIGPLPDEANPDDYTETGLHWPD